MKILIIILAVFHAWAFSPIQPAEEAQTKVDTIEPALNGPTPMVIHSVPEKFTSGAESLISEGFSDVDFPCKIEVLLQSDQMLHITTEYTPWLQYTLSNVDGRILKNAFFKEHEELTIEYLPEGNYALYFFAGKKVVRAVMIKKTGTDQRPM
jgi:hypothetical protein